MTIRKLQKGDERLAELFLAQYAETSMILRGNIRLAGLEYKDALYHGNYFGSFTDTGNIDGVLAHYWNGNILMQAPDVNVLSALVAVFQEAVVRPIAGVIGVDGQARFVVAALGLSDQEFSLNRNEKLYALDLGALKLPPNLNGRWKMKEAREADPETLFQWMKSFEIESLHAEDNDDLVRRVKNRVDRAMDEPDFWILEVDGCPVALNGFNARLPDSVQIGSVWTPPEHRGRGYVRSLLALTLQVAKKQGVEKAILFTDNPAAIKAYEAIGFREIGSYRLALLKKPIDLKERI